MNFGTHENFLMSINELDLIQKIKNFRSLNFKFMSKKEISEAINKVLMYNNQFLYISQMSCYPSNTKFFRVRALDGTMVPNKNLRISSDFWSPPEKNVDKYGRLNKPGESLLYTAPINPFVAIKEMKLAKGTYYALIVYQAKDVVKVNVIGGEYDYNKIGIKEKKAILINELYNNFLRDEFSRDVGTGTEYLYKISEIIAKNYFDLPPREVQDAWAYSSVQDKSNYNVCFRPLISKELLELQGAMIVRNNDPDEINVCCVAHGFDENGIAKYHRLGSDIQKRYFPEIQY